jgi:hypothetical protein
MAHRFTAAAAAAAKQNNDALKSSRRHVANVDGHPQRLEQ